MYETHDESRPHEIRNLFRLNDWVNWLHKILLEIRADCMTVAYATLGAGAAYAKFMAAYTYLNGVRHFSQKAWNCSSLFFSFFLPSKLMIVCFYFLDSPHDVTGMHMHNESSRMASILTWILVSILSLCVPYHVSAHLHVDPLISWLLMITCFIYLLSHLWMIPNFHLIYHIFILTCLDG